MADLARSYTMGTSPAITHTVSYEVKRSGGNVQYRFKVSTAPLSSGAYFGFGLTCTIALNGKTVLSGGSIKSYSPDSWSSAIVNYFPSATGWYTVSGVTSASTLSASVSFAAVGTSGSASSSSATVTVPVGTAPTAPSVVLSAAVVAATSTVKVGVSGGAWGDSGIGKYTYQYSKDNSAYTAYYTGTATSANFRPADYGAANGNKIYLRIIITNARNLTATSAVKTLTCATVPAQPVITAITPASPKYTDMLTITWGSVSDAASYELRVRYMQTDTYTDWSNFKTVNTTSTTTTPSNYTAFTVIQEGALEYSVRAKNAAGLYSDWSPAFPVSLKKNSIWVKINGIYKRGKPLVKKNGSWVEAKQVYVKQDNTWKGAK